MAQSTLYSDIKDMPEHPFQPVSFKFKLHIDFAKIKFAKFLKISARSAVPDYHFNPGRTTSRLLARALHMHICVFLFN